MMNMDRSKLDDYFFQDSVILEIDKDYLRTKIDPIIPKEKREVLVKGIHKLINMKKESIKSLKSKYPSLFSFKYEQLYWKWTELHMKKLFLNFFISTINNYLGFYKSEDEIFGSKFRAENIFEFEKCK